MKTMTASFVALAAATFEFKQEGKDYVITSVE
jgi:hypothetical protein